MHVERFIGKMFIYLMFFNCLNSINELFRKIYIKKYEIPEVDYIVRTVFTNILFYPEVILDE